MFGTEGRREGNQIPPIDKVFDVISFKGADIRELTVCETPSSTPQASAPTTSATPQTAPSTTTTTANATTVPQQPAPQVPFGSINTPSTDQVKTTTATQQQQQQQQQLPPSMQNMSPFAQQPFLNNPFVSPFQQFGPYAMPFNPYFPNYPPMQNFGPFAPQQQQGNVPTSAPTNLAPFTAPQTTSIPSATTKDPTVNPTTVETKPTPPVTTTAPVTSAQTSSTVSAKPSIAVAEQSKQTLQETPSTNGAIGKQQDGATVSEEQKNFNKGGRGGHRGRGNYNRGQGHRGQPTKTFKEQMEEFDFQTSNAQFDKEALKKEVEPPVDSKFYDKTSSFFDTISRDSNKENARTKQERDDQYKLDVETFGSNTVHQIRNQHRFSHRGRGGNFRGGNRGGRGNYRNTNYRNTNKQEQQ